MKAADNLVDIIKELIQQEIEKRDRVVLCEVAAVSDGGRYCDVYVVPDNTTIIHNIPNMTNFTLKTGDYCYVYKIQNSFANAFVCYNKNISNIANDIPTYLSSLPGYNAAHVQTLTNNRGVLQWTDVDD